MEGYSAMKNLKSQGQVNRHRSAYQEYARWCQERGHLPIPVTLHTVGPYLVSRVNRLDGSTASLDNKLSNLRLYVKRVLLDVEWLDEEEERQLKETIAVLKYNDFREVKRAKPLTQEIVDRLVDYRGSGTLLDGLLRAIYTTGHDGLMRGGEITSGLFRGDLTSHSDGKGITIDLDRTKAHRVGGPEKVKLRRGLNNSTYSGAFNLFSWVSRSNPRGQLDRVVFPEITFEKGVPIGIDWSISLTKDSLVKALRHDLSQIGLDSTGYSGHSFRAGGATDLFTSGLLTLEQIMKVGRWRSISAALVYYRDELITATLAADAFGRSRRAGA